MSEENDKQNIEQEESDARFLIAELAKQNQREHKEKLLILKLWFVSVIIIVAAFLLYLYQYDFVSQTVTVDSGESGGTANYLEGSGGIYNGSDYGSKEIKD